MTALTEPRYWMNESSGVLRPVVVAYLRHEMLDDSQVAIMRTYLRQWIDATVWDANPHSTAVERQAMARLREAAKDIATREDISEWLLGAQVNGIDPL
jgi:hypothetical protein